MISTVYREVLALLPKPDGIPEPIAPMAFQARSLSIIFFASSTSPKVLISASVLTRCRSSSLSITNIFPSEEYAALNKGLQCLH